MSIKLTLQDVLTPKQFRVALLVTSGMKNSEIAMILRTTENVVKNIMRDVFDRAGFSNRVELALLLVFETETGMYDREKLDQELAILRELSRGIDEDLALIEPTKADSCFGPASHRHEPRSLTEHSRQHVLFWETLKT
jgi:DNA-binding CsgD family transcriptional regulator